MRDYLRDNLGRFADVPGVGNDAINSATTPGGTRTSIPSSLNEARPTPLRTASGTTLNSQARLNNPTTTPTTTGSDGLTTSQRKTIRDKATLQRALNSKSDNQAIQRGLAARERAYDQDDAVIAALKGDNTKTPDHLGGQPKATKTNPITRNEIGYRLGEGLGPHFNDSLELTATIKRLRAEGTIRDAPGGGMYLGRPKKWN
jgi:hypothetical protein